MQDDPNSASGLLRRWVETWKSAGAQLDEIRKAENRVTDTREAIRQIFGADLDRRSAEGDTPSSSGLVEQQAWFSRIRLARENR